MVVVVFGLLLDSLELEFLCQEFFDCYQEYCVVFSWFYDGIFELFVVIEKVGLIWGVVINKLVCFVELIMQCLGYVECFRVLVCLDYVICSKFDFELLLLVCSQFGIDLLRVLFIGDDLCDIEFGCDVGIKIVVVCYGYIYFEDNFVYWGVDVIVDYLCEFIDVFDCVFCDC